MRVEPIGVAIIALGFACILFGSRFALISLALTALLGSAAAVFLGSGGQIQPAHLLLAFVVPTIFCRRKAVSAALRVLIYPEPGFWLAFAVVFGIGGAALLPRIFTGMTLINAIGATDSGSIVGLTPLAPVSGNVTQSIYFISDLALFLTVVGVSASKDGLNFSGKVMLWYATANISFGLIDIITFYSGTSFILDPIRNAQYTLHVDEVSNGLKRIAGSFPETSTFSSVTLGMFAFSGTLWLYARWSIFSGIVALFSALFLILSTSSTGLVGAVVVAALLYATSLSLMTNSDNQKAPLIYTFGLPAVLICVLFLIAFNPGLSNLVADYFNSLLFDKSTSQSGMERASWNAAAIQNFFDTEGLGAGLGSVRASSFIVAVPANLGIPGVVMFLGFFSRLLFWRKVNLASMTDIGRAAQNGCLGILVAACVSGSLIDLGLEFYMLAGLASAANMVSHMESLRRSNIDVNNP